MKLLASLIFFTRLPFWKIADVPPVYFKRVVDYWPFVGWLTGGIMAGTLWITAEFLPVQIAVLMALAARLLVTGALHEDGLADFCDGFGGGTSRDKILSIICLAVTGWDFRLINAVRNRLLRIATISILYYLIFRKPRVAECIDALIAICFGSLINRSRYIQCIFADIRPGLALVH